MVNRCGDEEECIFASSEHSFFPLVNFVDSGQRQERRGKKINDEKDMLHQYAMQTVGMIYEKMYGYLC